jgi:hypothetical protein
LSYKSSFLFSSLVLSCLVLSCLLLSFRCLVYPIRMTTGNNDIAQWLQQLDQNGGVGII